MFNRIAVVCFAVGSMCATPSFGQATSSTPADVVANVVAAADSLLGQLDETQRANFLFDFDDQVQRRRWSNLPTGIVPRRGLRMGDLNEAQRGAVMRLLKSTLSERGVQQVVDNMNGDEILKGGGGRGRTNFGKDEYYVSLLGRPSVSTPWMWQFGGHHLAINATIVGDQITLSPSLTGGQPVDYTLNDRKVRQLAGDEDKSFALIAALSDEQQKQAVIGDDHVDLAFGPTAESIEPKQEGISAASLDAQQRDLLLAVIEERVGILNDVHSKMTMKKIEKDLPSTYFAWFGPTAQGSVASYRIQGPSVIIEYSPQHLGGNAADHTHAMYRDPSNDYGVGLTTAP